MVKDMDWDKFDMVGGGVTAWSRTYIGNSGGCPAPPKYLSADTWPPMQ